MDKKERFLLIENGAVSVLNGGSNSFPVISQSKDNYLAKMLEMRILTPACSSGKGMFSLLPKGKLMSDLISDYLRIYLEEELESSRVITPFLYALDSKENNIEIFKQRMFTVKSPEGSSFFLKPNADIGLFRMFSGYHFPEESLPLRVYEDGRCYRHVLSGELSGIRKSRSFNLFDAHSFCADVASGIDEYFYLLASQKRLQEEIGYQSIDWFKVPSCLLDAYLDTITKHEGPKGRAIIEVQTEKRLYWDFKSFSIDDNGDRLFHLQLDRENPAKHGINYKREGIFRPCTIIHNSLGTIERWLLIIFKQALKKPVPVLPLWLSPVQIRLILTDEEHGVQAANLADWFSLQKIRVETDDRNISVSHKVKEAEKDWIPFSIVFGEKEANNQESLLVRQRGGDLISMSPDEIINLIRQGIGNKPFRPAINRSLMKY